MPPADENKHQEPLGAPHPTLVEILRVLGRLIATAAWRISYRNRELIPENDGRGLLIASNHQTYFDPFWVCLPIYRPLRFLAWDKAMEWFLIGDLIRALGAFPVNIERGSVGSMKESLKILKSGATLMVFPEGSRAFADGDLLKFKQGAARLALGAGVPVLPVTIRGGNRVWPRGANFPLPGKVEVIYHEVIETNDFLPEIEGKERAKALTEKIREVISSAI